MSTEFELDLRDKYPDLPHDAEGQYYMKIDGTTWHDVAAVFFFHDSKSRGRRIQFNGRCDSEIVTPHDEWFKSYCVPDYFPPIAQPVSREAVVNMLIKLNQ